MPSSFLRISLLFILCAAFSPCATAQAAHILGAPFTATKTLYESKDAQPQITQLARASDGSVYAGVYGRDGKLFCVSIEDVPNNRRVFYFVRPPGDSDHTYTLSTQRFFKDTIEQERERLRRNQQHWTDEPDLEKNNKHARFTSLGERPGDGMTLFGVRVETAFDNGHKSINERWESDFGLIMSSDTEKEDGRTYHSAITNLRREEPDPSLFQIPKEYLDDPLLDANTLFVDNQSGSAEVLNGAMREFDDWKKLKRSPPVKQFAIVTEKNSADLIATLTRASVTDHGEVSPGVKLQVYLRDSREPIFEVAERSPGTAHDDEFGALRCVEQFFNRIANTHVGPRETGHHAAETTKSE